MEKGEIIGNSSQKWRENIKMPTYDVIILPSAERDISRNVDYIFYDKHSPETASQLLAGFRKKIQSLDYMPERYELDEDDDLSARGIRKCYFKNYKIFFYVEKRVHQVYILRVLHMLVDATPLLLDLDF